jgi:hypothetical protein
MVSMVTPLIQPGRNVQKIFPQEEEFRSLYNAAWEAYIVFCKPFDNVFDLLEREYSRAVDDINMYSIEKTYWMNPYERLVEHLMILYWRGKLSLDDSTTVLARFYERHHLYSVTQCNLSYNLHDT